MLGQKTVGVGRGVADKLMETGLTGQVSGCGSKKKLRCAIPGGEKEEKYCLIFQ